MFGGIAFVDICRDEMICAVVIHDSSAKRSTDFIVHYMDSRGMVGLFESLIWLGRLQCSV